MKKTPSYIHSDFFRNNQMRILIIMLLFFSILPGQNQYNFNPMHIGNKWQYAGFTIVGLQDDSFNNKSNDALILVKELGPEKIINGKRYFLFTQYFSSSYKDSIEVGYSFQRRDSISGATYTLDIHDINYNGDTMEELLVDSLNGEGEYSYISYRQFWPHSGHSFPRVHHVSVVDTQYYFLTDKLHAVRILTISDEDVEYLYNDIGAANIETEEGNRELIGYRIDDVKNGDIFFEFPDSTTDMWEQMFPLKIGDFRIYKVDCQLCDDGTGYFDTIVKDTVFEDGNKYYKSVEIGFNEMRQWTKGYHYWRVDSNGYVWDGPNRFIIDLNVAEFDTVWQNPFDNSSIKCIVKRITHGGMTIIEYDFQGFFDVGWREKLGYYYSVGEGYSTGLVGANINGQVFGDTSLTFLPIHSDEYNIPHKLILHNAYPNPFNPTTTIKYTLPTSGNVELLIFNIKGQQVFRNSYPNQPTGLNHIEFDGSALSSGIYFYQVRFKGFLKTKKFILLK